MKNHSTEYDDWHLARLCWNTNGWKQPSGEEGKARNSRLYEVRKGYGIEEWLFDFDILPKKRNKEWKYGFIQALNSYKYEGKSLKLILYCIDHTSKKRVLVASIAAAKVISADDSQDDLQRIKQEAKEIILSSIKKLKNYKPPDKGDRLVNLCFEKKSVNIFSIPFRKSLVGCTRYNILQKIPEKLIPILKKNKIAI